MFICWCMMLLMYVIYMCDVWCVWCVWYICVMCDVCDIYMWCVWCVMCVMCVHGIWNINWSNQHIIQCIYHQLMKFNKKLEQTYRLDQVRIWYGVGGTVAGCSRHVATAESARINQEHERMNPSVSFLLFHGVKHIRVAPPNTTSTHSTFHMCTIDVYAYWCVRSCFHLFHPFLWFHFPVYVCVRWHVFAFLPLFLLLFIMNLFFAHLLIWFFVIFILLFLIFIFLLLLKCDQIQCLNIIYVQDYW